MRQDTSSSQDVGSDISVCVTGRSAEETPADEAPGTVVKGKPAEEQPAEVTPADVYPREAPGLSEI